MKKKRMFLLLLLLTILSAEAKVDTYVWVGWDTNTTEQSLKRDFKAWKKHGVVGVCVNCAWIKIRLPWPQR